jgi:hypothetical protein
MTNSTSFRSVVFALVAVLAVAGTGCGADAEGTNELLVGAPDVPGSSSGDVSALTGQRVAPNLEIEALNAANLRAGPSAKETILLVIPRGEFATIVEGEPKNGFYQVSFAGREGWTFGEHFRLAPIGQVEEAVNVSDILNRAKSAVGFSYWWGHGVWRPFSTAKGSCSGGCPSCSHSGSYGADCSGMAAKAWAVPDSNYNLSADSHPYVSGDWTRDNATYWFGVARGSAAAGDSFARDGHVFIYEAGDPWGSMLALECRGCSEGCVRGYRTATSDYVVKRRRNLANAGAPTCGTLGSGQALGVGASLKSCNGAATLIHQGDGNVVVYDRLGALWSTATNGKATSIFAMQTDGNLVLYSNTSTALWATTTHWSPGSFLRMQDDCNLVMYSSGGIPNWVSNTRCR